jgi:mannose-6-phosphate isomerase-like protein (cupin superfamily)
VTKTATLILAALLLGSPALAADETVYWSGADLKAYERNLAPKINEQHFAIERLPEFGSHYVLVVHRQGNGPAELHAAETDFYVVQSGEATLHTGGEVVGGKTTAPGEIRGQSIRGGRTIKLGPGDTVNIPPGTAHQVVLESGKQITYLIVKIKK